MGRPDSSSSPIAGTVFIWEECLWSACLGPPKPNVRGIYYKWKANCQVLSLHPFLFFSFVFFLPLFCNRYYFSSHFLKNTIFISWNEKFPMTSIFICQFLFGESVDLFMLLDYLICFVILVFESICGNFSQLMGWLSFCFHLSSVKYVAWNWILDSSCQKDDKNSGFELYLVGLRFKCQICFYCCMWEVLQSSYIGRSLVPTPGFRGSDCHTVGIRPLSCCACKTLAPRAMLQCKFLLTFNPCFLMGVWCLVLVYSVSSFSSPFFFF